MQCLSPPTHLRKFKNLNQLKQQLTQQLYQRTSWTLQLCLLPIKQRLLQLPRSSPKPKKGLRPLTQQPLRNSLSCVVSVSWSKSTLRNPCSLRNANSTLESGFCSPLTSGATCLGKCRLCFNFEYSGNAMWGQAVKIMIWAKITWIRFMFTWQIMQFKSSQTIMVNLKMAIRSPYKSFQ